MLVLMQLMEGFIMNVRPIPRSLLIHSIEYKEVTEGDGWDDSYKDPLTIYNVRVNPVKSLSRNSESISSNAKHIVLVDRLFSSAFPDFVEKSLITWNGNDYELVKVNPFYDTRKAPHHYELELR